MSLDRNADKRRACVRKRVSRKHTFPSPEGRSTGGEAWGGLGRPVTDGQAETASARGHGTEMALHVKFHDEGSRAFAPMTGCSDLIALYQPSQIGAPKAFHGRAVPVQDIPQ